MSALDIPLPVALRLLATELEERRAVGEIRVEYSHGDRHDHYRAGDNGNGLERYDMRTNGEKFVIEITVERLTGHLEIREPGGDFRRVR